METQKEPAEMQTPMYAPAKPPRHRPHDLYANESEMTDLLYTALAAAQGDYPAVLKNAKGAFGMYATVDALLDAVRPINSKHGLSLKSTTQIVGEEEYLVTTLGHKSGQFTRSVSRIAADPMKPQAYLAYCTYMRRLHIACLCGIAAETDDDGVAATEATKTSSAQSFRLEEMALKKLKAVATEQERDEVLARVAMRVGSGEMTENQLEILKKEREKLRAKTPPNTESKA
jgi:hypothetical protein